MSKKCPECKGKGGFDLIDGKEVPSVAWCLDSSHGRECSECNGTGYSPEKVEPKENNMSGHGKIVCSKCGVLIAQCRCFEGHNNIEYRVCDKCKNPEEGKPETLEELEEIINNEVIYFHNVTAKMKDNYTIGHYLASAIRTWLLSKIPQETHREYYGDKGYYKIRASMGDWSEDKLEGYNSALADIKRNMGV